MVASRPEHWATSWTARPALPPSVHHERRPQPGEPPQTLTRRMSPPPSHLQRAPCAARTAGMPDASGCAAGAGGSSPVFGEGDGGSAAAGAPARLAPRSAPRCGGLHAVCFVASWRAHGRTITNDLDLVVRRGDALRRRPDLLDNPGHCRRCSRRRGYLVKRIGFPPEVLAAPPPRLLIKLRQSPRLRGRGLSSACRVKGYRHRCL